MTILQKSSLCLGLLFAASVWAETATAASRGPWYLEIGGGLNRRSPANDEIALASFDPGSSLSVGVGYRLEGLLASSPLRHLRVGLEYSRQHNAIDQLWAYPLGGYPNGAFWGANAGRLGLRNPAMDAIIRALSPSGQTISEYYATRFNYPEDARGSIDFESTQLLVCYDFDFDRYTVYLGVGTGAGRSILKNLATPFLDYLAAPGAPIRTLSPGNLYATPNGSRYDLNYTTHWAWVVSPRLGVSYRLTPRWDLVTEARYWTAPNRVRVEAYPELDPANITHPNVDGWSFEIRLRYNL